MAINKDEIAAMKAVAEVSDKVGLGTTLDDETLTALRKACTKLLRLPEQRREHVVEYVNRGE